MCRLAESQNPGLFDASTRVFLQSEATGVPLDAADLQL
jgi:hypothetical protein